MTEAPDQGRVWITGSSSGLGRALALHMARQGWEVIASARSADALDRLAAEVPGRIHPAPLDITDRQAVSTAVADILAQHGTIDLAVLNAGTYEPDGIEGFTAERLAQIVGLNLIGTGNCLEPLLAHFRERGAGHVALVASLSGYRGLPQAASYGASKAGLICLAESLRAEAHNVGIKVQVINPGFVETPLTARNDYAMPFLMPVEAAVAALYRGLMGSSFEIVFPRRLAAILKLARMMPYRLYFPLVHRVTGQ